MSSLPLISSCFCCRRRTEPKNRQLPSICCVQAVLFDVDGTLVDSDPLHYLAFRDMLTEVSLRNSLPIRSIELRNMSLLCLVKSLKIKHRDAQRCNVGTGSWV